MRRVRPLVRRRSAVMFVILAGLAATNGVSWSAPRTWRVTPRGDGDAPTIQAAVDSASIGDVVELADGVYSGDGNFNIIFRGWDESAPGDTMVVRSRSNDPSRCIVDGGDNLRGFYLLHTDPTTFVLAGVTVTNAVRAVVSNPGYRDNRVTLRDCVFRDIEKDGFSTSGQTRAIISRCVFANNEWNGINTRYASSATVTGCEFSQNGVGASVSESSAEFTDCRFVENTGAMRILDQGSVTVTRCRFMFNTRARGGAIQSVDGGLEAVDCLFQGNSASLEGGAFYGDSGYPASFDGCVFAGNSAGSGAAVFLDNASGSVDLSRSTLVGNSAPLGSAMFCVQSDDVALDAVVIAFNAGGAAVDSDDQSTVDASCSDVFGNPGGDWSGPLSGQDVLRANISADPLFCEPSGGDFHVTSDSPCLLTACGTIGAFGLGCDTMRVALDIAPGSCPNTFSLDQRTRTDPGDRNDLVSVSLLGALYFDAHDVAPESVRLEGLAPDVYEFNDVSGAPIGGSACDCALPGADGFDDLTLRFLKASLANTIGLEPAGHTVTLTVSGRMNDGTPFTAQDCVAIVGRVALYNGVPNPFNPTTQIRYFLPRRTFVRLTVFDVLGRRVDQLVATEQEPGDHIVQWNARSQSSGVYFCQLEADGFRDARKVVLVK